MRTKMALVSVLLLAALGGYWWYGHRGPGASAPAAPSGAAPGAFAMPVEATAVRVGRVTESVDAVGTLRANEAIVVRPEVGGRIRTIHFAEGQTVAKGKPLFTLDGSIFEAELEQARTRLDLSRTNYDRIASLLQRGLSTEQERDQVRSELRVNEAALALAQAQLEKMTIRAPFDGMLGLRQVSVGDYVSPGHDMINLLDLDPIKVDFRIPEIYLGEVETGQSIEVRVDAFPDEVVAGEVFAIDPQVDVNGRALVLRAWIRNESRRLKAGLFARVNLIFARREGAVLVPEDALVPSGDQQMVYRVVEGTVAVTRVTIGQRKDGEVEIVTGLAQGDTVITAGQLKIRDGAPVSVVDTTPAS